MLTISDITIEKLKSGALENELPEIYELKNTIENNSSHINDPVFEHTLSVLVELQNLFGNFSKSLTPYLQDKVTKYSKKELLFIAALLHDIAKPHTKTIIKDGWTKFAGHEEAGAIRSKTILDRFDLSDSEKDLITGYIKNHGILHGMILPDNLNMSADFINFKKEFPDIWLELVIICFADTLGNQLKIKNPEIFNFKNNFYRRELDKFYYER